MNKLFLAIILIAHAVILTKLIFFPYPEFFIYPYLTNHGLLPYSQILDQHFPGLMFLPVNLNNLGMTSPEIARIWLIAIVLLTQILLFIVSRPVLKSEKKALLVNLLFLIWQPYFEGWVLWIDNLLPLFLLPAFYFSLKFLDKKKNRDLFLIGLFLGVGAVFKQVLIPLAAILFLYLFWNKRNLKTFTFFSLGFLPPILLMIFYLFSIGVFSDFWYWTVVFNLTTFASDGRKYPTIAQLARVGFITILGGGIILTRNKKLILSLTFFALIPIIEIYARFDFVHFQPGLPFILLGFVAGIFQLKKVISVKYFWALVAFLLAITLWWQGIFYKGHVSDKIFFYDEQVLGIASKIRQYTKPNEKIFIFGTVPHLYQITQTLPAGDLFIFQFPWFMKIAQERILDGIKKDKPNIIISDRTVVIEGQKITDFASRIDQYIQENYTPIDFVGEAMIMKRKIP